MLGVPFLRYALYKTPLYAQNPHRLWLTLGANRVSSSLLLSLVSGMPGV